MFVTKARKVIGLEKHSAIRKTNNSKTVTTLNKDI